MSRNQRRLIMNPLALFGVYGIPDKFDWMVVGAGP